MSVIESGGSISSGGGGGGGGGGPTPGATGLINVKDYGAVGDGVTDDAAAIQDAIDTGLSVIFPPAVYAVGSTLTLDNDGQSYTGFGATLKKTGNFDILTITGNRNTVEGFFLNGNSHTGAGLVVSGDLNLFRDLSARDNADGFVIYGPGAVPGADINRFEGCEAYGNDGSGFYLHNATDTCIINCSIQTNGQHGVLLEDQSYSLKLIGCMIDDNNISAGAYHNVTVREGDSLCIVGCVITNCNGTGHGVFFDPSGGDQFGMRVSDSVLAQNNGYGVYIDTAGANECSRVVVSGCRFVLNTSGSVYVDTGSSNCVIVGNDLTGDAVDDNGTDTIIVGNDTGNAASPLAVAKAGSLVGTRPRINLIEGSGVTLTVTDDGANDEVDIEIAASGSLGAAWFQQFINTTSWTLITGTESSSNTVSDMTRQNNNTANNIQWSQSIRIPAGSYKIDMVASKGNARGIIDVLLGGSVVASYDLYDPGADSYPDVTIDLGALGGGTSVLSISVTTKNASSSAKGIVIRGIRLYQYA